MAKVHQCDMCGGEISLDTKAGNLSVFNPIPASIRELSAQGKVDPTGTLEKLKADPKMVMKLMMEREMVEKPALTLDLCGRCAGTVEEFITSSRTMMQGVKSGEVRVN